MSNKDVKDVAKKEVAQEVHEVKGELTYDDKVIQKIIGLSLEKVEGLLAIDGGFFSNLADKLINTDNVTNGVNVEVGKEQVAVDLNVVEGCPNRLKRRRQLSWSRRAGLGR